MKLKQILQKIYKSKSLFLIYYYIFQNNNNNNNNNNINYAKTLQVQKFKKTFEFF